MINKKIWLVFFIFILVAGIAYWQGALDGTDVSNMSMARDSRASTEQEGKTLNTDTHVDATSIGALIDAKSTGTEVVFTDQDWQDIKDWYKDSVHHQDYAAYDEASLLALADAGDVLAMKALVLKYFELGRTAINADELIEYTNKQKIMVEKAILYGDREFLDSMPKLRDAISRFTSPNSSPEEKHESMIDALAYAEFMGLRGDLESKYNEQALFFDIYKEWGAPDTLSDNEKQAIRNRAGEIYGSYEQKRIELGLGLFDNSISEGVAKRFEIERQKYLKKMGDKAI